MGGREKMKEFVVGSVPTLFYIPDFITDGEQDQLVNNIYQAPLSKWKSLKNRRLQNWVPPWLTRITQRINEVSGLFPSAINHVLINEYLPNQGIMPHQDGPAYFPVVAILSLGSPVVMDFTPHSSLSLCTNQLRNSVEDKISDGASDNHHPFSLLLMPRSLLIFKDEAYSDYLHGIKDSEVQQYDEAVNSVEALNHDEVNQPLPGLEKTIRLNKTGDSNRIHRTTNRVSLTCRVVSKVHKNLYKF
ncbi:alkylated DNA repair protein ALKBH6 homolog isoform X2 [Cornus florida]|uniref:alkylated DNA repair protein ALKBH6 homolog isoform X2 n=1 Tax=Cornus florida TaxID=4283 RepID=UPI0028A1E791|nr:alkylated DNA repair protein ALKBH6 homolog isoform X2 [Cornus florida]